MIRTAAMTASAVFLLFVTIPANADDFSPPAWRGEPLTFWAEWEFTREWYWGGNIEPEWQQYVGDGVHEWNEYCYTHGHGDTAWGPDPIQPGDGLAVGPGDVPFWVCNWDTGYPYKYL